MSTTISTITEMVKQKYIKRLKESGELLKKAIDENTAEDTKTLLGNNELGEIEISGNRLSISVTNNTEYAKFVEYGVKGGGYNYHKPKGIVFYKAPRGEGLGFFRRSFNQTKKDILEKLNM